MRGAAQARVEEPDTAADETPASFGKLSIVTVILSQIRNEQVNEGIVELVGHQ
jgi:hypothetical protein